MIPLISEIAVENPGFPAKFMLNVLNNPMKLKKSWSVPGRLPGMSTPIRHSLQGVNPLSYKSSEIFTDVTVPLQ